MASLVVATSVSVNLQPLASASGRRGAANGGAKSISGSRLRSAEMAMTASIAALPVGGRSLALAHAANLRFQSSSCRQSRVRCNAKLLQDDAEESGSANTGADSSRMGAAAAAAAIDVEEKGFKRELQGLKEDLGSKMTNFWQNFKEQHVVYKRDRDQWGLGFKPIFTVHEDAEGNRYRVDVIENEILVRSGIDPNATQFASDECKALAERRIELAKDHAKDVQLGLVNPSPLSVLYEYKREMVSRTVDVGDGSRPWSSLDAASVSRWQFLSLLIFLLSVASLVMGVKWLFSKKKAEEDPDHEKNLRLMQMRKLKAHMSRQTSDGTTDNTGRPPQVNGSTSVINGEIIPGQEKVQPKEVFGEIVEAGHPRVNDKEFQRKVTEIRAMARKARLQEKESAEARSGQGFERKRSLEQERSRSQGFENLAGDLDDVHRFGAESSNGPDFIANAVELSEEKENFPKLDENGEPSLSQEIDASSDNPPSKQPGTDSPLRPGSLPAGAKSNSPPQKSNGVKPRIILSAEEARSRIAAKRARLSVPYSTSSLKAETGQSKSGNVQSSKLENVDPPATETSSSTNATELRGLENTSSLSTQETPIDRAIAAESGPAVCDTGDNQHQTYDPVPVQEVVTKPNESASESNSVNRDKNIGGRTRDGTTRGSGLGRDGRKSKDEEEEMEWMRDDVLREIVFKVQANEEAGREPFHNLNSEQETLFFKGLERKFEREGDEVKKWIKDRVENIDYGSDGISIYDPPESYELKWKQGVDKAPKSEFYDKFTEDRMRIINEKKRLTYTTPPDLENKTAADLEKSPSLSSPSPSPLSAAVPPSPVSSSPASQPLTKNNNTMQGRSGESNSRRIERKTVISSSPRTGKSSIPSTSPSTKNGDRDADKENWDHTKRWAKDLERKYAMEEDPDTKALMREIGKDLDRWITEDEIEAASRMLDKGVEGEQEYARMHYEKIKEKIKKQHEMFGPEAMLSKYSEYKSEPKEVELWWLGLPFVVCIGLLASVEGEQQTGLYSVDVGAALEGVRGVPSVSYHTVAFQDRGDAQNFCTLVNSQPEKLGAEGAEPVPFDPKELYKDAKSEGYKVIVIKKGQLQLSVDKAFEEVESRIVELGSARYFDELIRDRVIDMDAVVDEGLGFGRRPQ